jgi:ABC-2 type transport system ATP-binding protein
MISVVNLSKKYGATLAVDDLTLQVDKELFVFLGPNGAGKTTTIKMMTGLLAPSGGSIHINDIDLASRPLEAKKNIGLVPEQPFLYEKLSGREFLQFVTSVYEVPHGDARRRLDRLFEIFDLTDRADDLIESYSHGMKQKVALAGALVHDPKVLFLDEPTIGLDPKAARNLKDILRGLVDKGTTVFMSTHILEVAERMCDRIGIIHKGKLAALGTLQELRGTASEKTENLEDLFLHLTGSSPKVQIEEFIQDN